WSSDVCSSDLVVHAPHVPHVGDADPEPQGPHRPRLDDGAAVPPRDGRARQLLLTPRRVRRRGRRRPAPPPVAVSPHFATPATFTALCNVIGGAPSDRASVRRGAVPWTRAGQHVR